MRQFESGLSRVQQEYDSLGDFLRKNPGATLQGWNWRLPNPIIDPMLALPGKPPYRTCKVTLRSGEEVVLLDDRNPPPPEMLKEHKEALKSMAFDVLTEFALQTAREKGELVHAR